MEPAPNDDDEWAQYEESFMPEEHNNEVEEPNIEVEEPNIEVEEPNIEVEEPPPKQKNTRDVAPQLLEKPPRLYEDIIDETEWTEFVASRLTKEWGVTRKKAQASKAKNIYPHRSGRGGARMVELQMEKELGHQLVKIDRADLWKRLRTNSKGELEGPAVEVAQRIIEYEKFWKERVRIELLLPFCD
ncbi:hypothetical protein F8388_008003 [Cannabis sativa]|uniref:Uncharacterized protein n=1 Tax=Cannabis sativa TaxID=3483 RepID=A0A7J6H7X4_CANSA|nr:hypothetical protein F8388_008003 [Cannabis sativa]